MTNNTLVSVVVPNYNYARYLEERLESILNQTFQDFEIIILDDCSTDNSREIIEKYRNHPHVSQIVYNEKNSGSTFKQWNKGFQLAKGDLIWIAESDDTCESNLLEKLVAEFNQDEKLVLAFSLTRMFRDDGWTFDIPALDKTPKNIVNGRRFIHRYMADGCYITNASSALFKKSAALTIEPLYMQFKSCGDRMFWIEIAEKGNVAIINERLNYCRRHQATVTSSNTISGVRQLEGRAIMDFIYKKGYISKREDLVFSSRYVLANIYYQEFKDKSTRKELMKVWRVGCAKRFILYYLVFKGNLSRFIKKL